MHELCRMGGEWLVVGLGILIFGSFIAYHNEPTIEIDENRKATIIDPREGK